MRGVALRRPAWLVWGGGLLAGAAAYPLGYLLVVRKAGSLDNLMAFLRQQQAIVDPLRSGQALSQRMAHVDGVGFHRAALVTAVCGRRHCHAHRVGEAAGFKICERDVDPTEYIHKGHAVAPPTI
jgi:Tfp pilus assembly protein PilN